MTNVHAPYAKTARGCDRTPLAKADATHYFVQCSKAIALGGLAVGGPLRRIAAPRAQCLGRGRFSDLPFAQTFSLPDLLRRVFGPGVFLPERCSFRANPSKAGGP